MNSPTRPCARRAVVLFSLLALTSITARAALPLGWTATEVGSPVTAGSQSFADGTYTITGSGGGINSQGDSLHFVYSTLFKGGDFRLTVHLTNFTGGPGSQVGLIVRKSSDPHASMGSVVYEPGRGNSQNNPNLFEAIARDAEPGAYYPWRQNGNATPVAAPVWLQLVRSGNDFAGYKSTDGKFWMQVHNDSGGPFRVTGPIQVGLMIASGNSNPVTATIDHVRLERDPVLPYETSWVGNTSSSDSDSFTSSGTGAMLVDPDGTLYTGSFWDEGGEAGKSYKDGKVVHGFTLNHNGTGEGSIAKDDTHLYYYAGVSDRLNQLYRCNLAGELFTGDFFPLMQQTPIRDKGGTYQMQGMATANGELFISDQLTNQVLVFNLKLDTFGLPQNVTNRVTDHPIDTSGVPNPAPQAVYQSSLQTDAMGFIVPGLKPNQAYNVRLHFAETDPNNAAVGRRVMDLSVGGVSVGKYDVFATAGALYKATALSFNNARSEADGTMRVSASRNHASQYDWMILSGIEITNLDGTPAIAYNCGGAAVGNWKSTIPEMPDRAFPLTRPGPIAADRDGHLWIIQEATSTPSTTSSTPTYTPGSAAIKLYDKSGLYLGKQITDVVNPVGITYDPTSDQLVVAENGPDQNIRIYKLSTGTPTQPALARTFGIPGGLFTGKTPGLIHDPDAGGDARFLSPASAGLDAKGNLYVVSSPGGQVILTAFDPSGHLLWRRFAVEFCNTGDFDPTVDRSDVWTPNHHYLIDYSSHKAGSEWNLKSFTANTLARKFPDNLGAGSSVVRRIQGKLFMFTCAQGNLGPLYVYRFDGEQIVPCGSFSDAAAGSESIWTDTNGDGLQQPGEVTVSRQDPASAHVPPGAPTQSFDIDTVNGDLYLAKCGVNAPNPHVDKYHFTGFNAVGAPTWSPTYTSFPGVDPFKQTWGNKARLRYMHKTDTMYMVGETFPYATQTNHEYGSTLAVYDHWSTKPVKRFILRLPDPDSEKNFMAGAPPYQADGFIYEAFDVANGLSFAIDIWGTIRVIDPHGKLIANIMAGPEVNGGNAWEDETMGLRVHYNATDHEYEILCENSGFRAKQDFYRWKDPRSR